MQVIREIKPIQYTPFFTPPIGGKSDSVRVRGIGCIRKYVSIVAVLLLASMYVTNGSIPAANPAA